MFFCSSCFPIHLQKVININCVVKISLMHQEFTLDCSSLRVDSTDSLKRNLTSLQGISRDCTQAKIVLNRLINKQAIKPDQSNVDSFSVCQFDFAGIKEFLAILLVQCQSIIMASIDQSNPNGDKLCFPFLKMRKTIQDVVIDFVSMT